MQISSIERRMRAFLPVVRFMQTSIPLPLANWLIKQSMKRVVLGSGMQREAAAADGVPCEWIIPQDCKADQALLYLHGGGFVFGLTPLHLHMGSYLAQQMGLRVLMVDYRLAPAHPFPAALDDTVSVYLWLLKRGILAQDIVVAGDSAGGNLTLTMMMKVRNSNRPLPAAAACISPVTDLTTEAKEREGFNDPLLPPRATRLYNRSYVGAHDPHDPLISPVLGDLRGLPPLLVHVGDDEVLREDAIRIAALAESANVDLQLEIYPRMWHVWQLFLALPQAAQSLGEIADFLKSHLRHTTPEPAGT